MSLKSILVAVALASCALVAHADTIYNFTITGAGNQNNTQNFAVNGSTTINITSGAIVAISFTANGTLFANTFTQTGPKVYVGGTTGNTSTQALFSFDASSLQNYSTLADSAFDLRTPDGTMYVGHLSQGGQVIAAVAPEPAPFFLLGTGILGVAGVVRKRFYRVP